MKAMKKGVLGAALVAALGFGSSAQADVVIDLFQGPLQQVATSTLGGTQFDQAGPLANVIGSYRDLQITKTGDNQGGVDVGESSLLVDSGSLQLSNAIGNKSVGLVTWDGNDDASTVDITGLGGVDLTAMGGDRFLATVFQADLGFDYKIRVWDMDGDLSTLSASVQFPVGAAVDSDYLFSWFNLASGNYCDGGPALPCDPNTQLAFNITRAGGLIDFSNIGALQLELSNGTVFSVDLAIGSIRVPEVPEPGGLALVGAALLGAGFARRKQRSGK